MVKTSLLVLLLLAVLCFPCLASEKIDGSSPDSLKQSIDRIADELDRDRRKDFNEAIIVWYTKAVHSAAMDYKENYGHPPEDDDLDDEDISLIAAEYLEGMTAEEVTEEARAIDEEELVRELEDMGLSHPLDLRVDLDGLIRVFRLFF